MEIGGWVVRVLVEMKCKLGLILFIDEDIVYML